MSKKIVMLGGRRAGKSSILASVLKCMKDELSIVEVTVDENTDAVTAGTDTLNDKAKELGLYLAKQKDNMQFVVDTAGNSGSSSYKINIGKANSISKTFEFIDVPGEWMAPNSEEGAKKRADGQTNHKWLISQVKEADVFIVAIDTPYLFEIDAINSCYNRTSEIHDILQNITLKDSAASGKDSAASGKIDKKKIIDKKMIIFCPVKAEKYFNNKDAIETVTEKVKQTYKNTINQWVGQGVEILIMPVKTVGGLEFVKMRTPVKYYANDKQQVCTVCGIDVYANINDSKTKLYAEDGCVIRQTSESRIELPQNQQDQFLGKWMFKGYIIPKAWYKCNGKGYCPQYCEQMALRIVKFLLKKDECVNKAQQEINNQNNNINSNQNKGFFYSLKAVTKAVKDAVISFVNSLKRAFSDDEYQVFKGILNDVESKKKLLESVSYPGFEEITGQIN